MKNDLDWNLLAKYFFDECSEEEEARIRAWMESDPQRNALVRQLHQALQNQKDPASSQKWDTDALWNRIQEETQLDKEEGASQSSFPSQSSTVPGESSRPERSRRKTRRLRRRHVSSSKYAVWAGAIAVVVAIAVIGTLWQQSLHENVNLQAESGKEYDSFITQKSERAMVRLTDGTRVHLNVDSRLVVPADFHEEKRRVELEGEAFFEVADDSTRPFIVESGEVVTRVLGTAFDVNAYPGDEEAKVMVSEGRVSLRATSEDTMRGGDDVGREDEAVVLTKNDVARITKSGNQVVRQEIDARDHLAWMDGELVLKNAPFDEVTQKLERWYDLEISLEIGEREAMPSGHLNARFSETQDLDEVLQVVTAVFKVEYERQGQNVTVRPLR